MLKEGTKASKKRHQKDAKVQKKRQRTNQYNSESATQYDDSESLQEIKVKEIKKEERKKIN